MLQTIYETESCFSSTSTDSNHQPLELLSSNRGSGAAMPTAGESSALGEVGRGMKELLSSGGLVIYCGKHSDSMLNAILFSFGKCENSLRACVFCVISVERNVQKVSIAAL